MAKRNSVNLDITSNADGFDISGGTTPRKITVSGGDVSMVGGGSAVITYPTSTATLATLALAETLTNKTISGASNTISGITEAMLSTSDVTTLNATTSKHGFLLKLNNSATSYMDGTGNWSTPGASGAKNSYDYIIYISGGTTFAYKTSDGTTLSSNADASVPIQAAVDACDATSGTGGRIYVQPGTYAMTTVVTIQGDNTTDSPAVALHGAGQQTTIFKPSVNVKGFTISNRAKVSMRDFAIIVRGSGDGLHSTNSSVGQRAFWQSEFKNIYIYDDGSSTAHSGWGINFGNPFRSVIENIEMSQVKNGMKLEALDTSTGYNPGDLTVKRMFIELGTTANGVGIQLTSPSTGDMNQMTFDMIEMITSATGCTGILFDGASGSNNHTQWRGVNVEQFDIILDLQKGRNNIFDFNYVITADIATPTYFKMATAVSAYNNVVSCRYMDTWTQAVTVLNDVNTLTAQRNIFRDIIIQGTATSLSYTRTDATKLEHIIDNATAGAISGVTEGGTGTVTTNAVEVNATHGTFVDSTDINSDTTRTAITLTNRAIRSTSTVNCFMMSAPDTNAMLVASVVPADGSATIYIRNCGTANQTSTFTMGFTVFQ